MDLIQKHCVPCEGGVPPMDGKQAHEYLSETLGWELAEDGKSIAKRFEFEDFVGAMAFVNKVAAVAEREGHHPDLHIFYNKVTIELSTHAIKGLSENDFILAAKINAIR